jgi:hypothetical protein
MVTVQNYKSDKLYPGVVRAFDALLTRGKVVAPVDVFLEMGNLDKSKYEDWRFGRVSSLESVILGNLSKCSRILKIIGCHAHDLDMIPSRTAYKKWGKGRKLDLKFSRSGNGKIEAKYATSFLWNKKKSYSDWKESLRS